MSGSDRKGSKKTTFWDFLIAFGSGVVNLLKIEKIICIIVLYLLGRDFYFTRNIDKGETYREKIIDTTSVLNLLQKESYFRDMIYIAIIAVLVVIIVIMIIVINTIYMREIQRLSKERSRLLHDIGNNNFTVLKKHNSSDREEEYKV